jgi:multidrug resistance efflux pump
MIDKATLNRAGMDGAANNLSDRVRSLRLNDQRANSRTGGTSYLPWAVSLVLLMTSVAFGYRAYRVGSLTPGGPAREEKKSSAAVPETTASAAVGEVVLQAKGYVTPISLVQVSPKVGGQLVTITERFREGERFEAGDVLATIESTDYMAEYHQAKRAWEAAAERYVELKRTTPEEIRQAENELDEARLNTQQMRLDADRNKRLAMGNALAQRDLEIAKYGYEASAAKVRRLEASLRMVKEARLQTRLDAARADMKQAEANLDKAEWRLENTTIRAPISGTILTKKAEQGNIVNPSAFSSGISASLCEMANLRALEIDLSIQEREVAKIKKGQDCWVMPEAYQSDQEFLALHPRGYAGRVSRLMPTADRAKGAIPVRVLILEIPEAEEGQFLRPDMGALVSFLTMPKKPGSGKLEAAPPTGRADVQPAALEQRKP